jgi:hypothetical protein
MITLDEMRTIAGIKTFAREAREAAIAAQKHSYIVSIFPVVGQLYDSIVKLTHTLDWFIEILERETGIPANLADIEMAEHLELVKRGKRPRCQG